MRRSFSGGDTGAEAEFPRAVGFACTSDRLLASTRYTIVLVQKVN